MSSNPSRRLRALMEEGNWANCWTICRVALGSTVENYSSCTSSSLMLAMSMPNVEIADLVDLTRPEVLLRKSRKSLVLLIFLTMLPRLSDY